MSLEVSIALRARQDSQGQGSESECDLEGKSVNGGRFRLRLGYDGQGSAVIGDRRGPGTGRWEVTRSELYPAKECKSGDARLATGRKRTKTNGNQIFPNTQVGLCGNHLCIRRNRRPGRRRIS